MLAPFIELFKNRKIIYTTTLHDLKSKNAGSMLGYLWLILYPVLFLGMYAISQVHIKGWK